MEATPPNLLQILEARVNDLMENGKVDEARKAADSAVDEARSNSQEDLLKGTELALSLEVKADLLRQLGEHEEAQKNYEEALSLLGIDYENDESIGRVCASLAVLHDTDGDTMMAKSRYERAIASFERLTPPAILDVADLSNNLAFIYQVEDNFDQAETLFLKALRISHEHLGKDHEQTASLCNNVGGLYFKADYDEQAREMHMMALEIREKTLGEHHLETAQSYANLALVLYKSDDIDASKRHFNRALDAYEGNLTEGREDYEIVAANFRDVLGSLGDDQAIKVLDERTAAKLK